MYESFLIEKSYYKNEKPMGQVSLYRFKSNPLEKIFLAPPDRKILDPCPSVDMVPPVYG